MLRDQLGCGGTPLNTAVTRCCAGHIKHLEQRRWLLPRKNRGNENWEN